MFCTLSYLFQHIWTNLLTQCTQCQFLSIDVYELHVYTHIYSARKIPQKIYKKSAFQKTPHGRRRARGGHRASRHPGCAACPLAARGGRLGGGHPLWCPTLAPIFTPMEETLIPEPFYPEAILISAAIANKFRRTRIPVSAPCRDGEVPPDSYPWTLLPPSMKRE